MSSSNFEKNTGVLRITFKGCDENYETTKIYDCYLGLFLFTEEGLIFINPKVYNCLKDWYVNELKERILKRVKQFFEEVLYKENIEIKITDNLKEFCKSFERTKTLYAVDIDTLDIFEEYHYKHYKDCSNFEIKNLY